MKYNEVAYATKYPEYSRIRDLETLSIEYQKVAYKLLDTHGTPEHKVWVDREKALCRIEFNLGKRC